MKPIKFEEVNCIFAKNQPEYLQLPVHKNTEGLVTSCWEFTFKERIKILFGGNLFIQNSTFNKPLQPQLPRLDNPFEVKNEE